MGAPEHGLQISDAAGEQLLDLESLPTIVFFQYNVIFKASFKMDARDLRVRRSVAALPLHVTACRLWTMTAILQGNKCALTFG